MSIYSSKGLDASAMAAVAIYDEAADTLDAAATVLRRADRPLAARVIAHRALLAHRAVRAEVFDPEPVARAQQVCCGWCLTYMNLPSEMKPPLYERVRS